MRIDSNTFDNQMTGFKSEVFDQKNNTNKEEKVDLTKKIQNKEENVALPGEKRLIEAIEKANKGMTGENTSLKVSIHKKTNDIVIKLIDRETKEVIKEIPSEKIIDMVAEMCERAGIFVDKRG
ncbi:MAG: flagellar protein FlaG [Tepidibacter sp.]|jgi:flagellar protein FlaG|uniref:flagellar protein FlaG n=1 Tax=Tepidibacter sp. TaxID=2529387 RepID=UPI0025EA252A|nr:flagellar protein FlaG [Tepidibacter sp.]MCT4508865.1 flagellar protein FlaG [Tepidibacter sp.]